MKVVSYIPRKFLPALDGMAKDEGRTRASMISRIIQATITKTAQKTFQDIREMQKGLEELRERMQKTISEMQEKMKSELPVEQETKKENQS